MVAWLYGLGLWQYGTSWEHVVKLDAHLMMARKQRAQDVGAGA